MKRLRKEWYPSSKKAKNLYDCKGVSWSFSHKIGRYTFVFQCAKYLKTENKDSNIWSFGEILLFCMFKITN